MTGCYCHGQGWYWKAIYPAFNFAACAPNGPEALEPVRKQRTYCICLDGIRLLNEDRRKEAERQKCETAERERQYREWLWR